MQLSILSILTALPGFNGGSDGVLPGAKGAADGQDAGGDSLTFNQWMEDNGINIDATAGDAPNVDVGSVDWLVDMVPNLVLAQGDAANTQKLDPAAILAALKANPKAGLDQLAQLTLTKDQSAKFAELMGQFLQRPDTAAELTEQQRVALAGMLAQLRQAAKSDAPTPVAPILASLDKVIPAQVANVKERAPVLSQMVKWLQQVLRDTVKQQNVTPAAGAVAMADVAPAKETALAAVFPAGAGDAATEEPSEEETGEDLSKNVVAVVTVPTQMITQQPAVVAEVPTMPQAVEALPQVQLPEATEEATPEEAPQQAAKKSGAAVLASIEFASLLEAAPQPMKEAAATVRPEMVQQVAQTIGEPKEQVRADKPEPKAGEGKISSMADVTQTQTANAVTAPEQTQATQQPASSTQAPVVAPIGVQGVQHAAQMTPSAQANAATHAHVPEPQKHALAEQVQVGIKQLGTNGVERITIQLTPQDMGRVDVRMDMGADGRAHIVFTVDKAEAHDQLQRDAKFLEKALQEAGVKADAGSMEFNLRHQNQSAFAQMAGNSDQGNRQPQWAEENDPAAKASDEAAIDAVEANDETITQNYTVSVNNGLDIRV